MLQAKPKPKRNLIRLRRELKRRGIPQRLVAEAAGVTVYHVCNVLAGRHTSRNVVTTAKRLLAEAKEGAVNGASGAANAQPAPDHAA